MNAEEAPDEKMRTVLDAVAYGKIGSAVELLMESEDFMYHDKPLQAAVEKARIEIANLIEPLSHRLGLSEETFECLSCLHNRVTVEHSTCWLCQQRYDDDDMPGHRG